MNIPRAVRSFLALAGSALITVSSASAVTYNWLDNNVTNTTPVTLDWFSGGSNTQANWNTTPGVQGSSLLTNADTVQFFTNNSTSLTNTVSTVRDANINNNGTAVQLGTLTLTGRASNTNTTTVTINIGGDALNFSAATGTINLDANNQSSSRNLTYNVSSNIQLGTVSSGSALTFTGNGSSSFTFSGNITELQSGGGSSLVKSGSSTATLSGVVGLSGGITLNGGTLRLNNASNSYSGGTTLNGGTLLFFNDAHLGSTSGTLTFNGGTLSVETATAGLVISSARNIVVNAGGATFSQVDNGVFETTGVLSGSGTITSTGGGAASARTLKFMSAANTFTGDINLTNRGLNVTVASLGDAGKIVADSGSDVSTFTLNSSGTTATTFNNRLFELRNSGTSNNAGNLRIANDSASSSATLNIGSDLLVTATTNKIFYLGGSNTGNNTFSGLIDIGSSLDLALVKDGTGTWVLNNDFNSYTGSTHIQAGTLSLSNLGNITGTSVLGASSTLIIGNGGNTGTLLYTGGAQSTDRTIQINNTTNNNTGGATIINDGTGALTFTATTFNPAYANTNLATRTLTLGGTNGGTIQGVIQDISATMLVGMTKTGTGTWTLSGANTYKGVTTAQQGDLVAGSNGAFGTATSEIVLGVAGGNNDTGILIGGAYTVGRNIRLATNNTTDTGTRVLTLGGNTAANSEFSGSIFLGSTNNAGRGVTLTAASGGQVTFSGVIQNPTSMDATTYTVTKSGQGTVVLTNANTYTGATTVSAGNLLVNNTTGSGTGTGTVTVGTSGTLGGTGAISGAVNVTGQLSPGVSIETFATGTLSMLDTSTLVHELNSSVADAVASDLLKVAGNLNLTGAVNLTLTDLALIDVAFSVNDTFSLINYTGTWNNGLFTLSGNELSDEEVFTFGLNTWKISYDDATGGLNYTGEYAGGTDSFVNITALTIIPEPSTALLGGLGILLLFRRRR